MKSDKTFLILLALLDRGDRIRARDKLIEGWPFSDELNLEIVDAECMEEALLIVQSKRPDAVLATLNLPDIAKAVDIPREYPQEWQMEVALLEKLATSPLDQSLSLTLACINAQIPYLKFYCDVRFQDPKQEFKAHRLELLFEKGEDGMKFGDTFFLRPDPKGRYTSFIADLQHMGLGAHLAENRYRRALVKYPMETKPSL